MFSPWVESFGETDKVCKDPKKTAEVYGISSDFSNGFNGNFIILFWTYPLIKPCGSFSPSIYKMVQI